MIHMHVPVGHVYMYIYNFAYTIYNLYLHRQVVARCWNASNSCLRVVGMHCPSVSQGEENGWLVRVCTGTLGRKTHRRAPLGCRSPVVSQQLSSATAVGRCHSRNPTTWGQTNQTVNLFTWPTFRQRGCRRVQWGQGPRLTVLPFIKNGLRDGGPMGCSMMPGLMWLPTAGPG